MCISTAYRSEAGGEVLAEHVTSIAQQGTALVLTDIMGAQTVVEGSLGLADLTRGIIVIQPAGAKRARAVEA